MLVETGCSCAFVMTVSVEKIPEKRVAEGLLPLVQRVLEMKVQVVLEVKWNREDGAEILVVLVGLKLVKRVAGGFLIAALGA